MPVVTQDLAEGLLISLDGDFQASDAWSLHDALAAVAPGELAIVDFDQVRAFHDFALALVAPDLARLMGPHLVLRGLRHHQRRILEYFGVRLAGPSVSASV